MYAVRRLTLCVWAGVLACVAAKLYAEVGSPRVSVVKDQGFLPFGGPPINYRSARNLADPVAKLQAKLERGETALQWEPGHGYLRSVLEALRVPVSSQTLVFSKTSLQYAWITPSSPRALYFNDDVYVGQVHGSRALEFVSFDPMQGAIFYILDEQRSERPVFERAQLDCVQCHVASSTRGVPGVLLRSISTARSGYQLGGTPGYITGHESPLNERFGGWYVTGTPGSETHMGNTLVERQAGEPRNGTGNAVRLNLVKLPTPDTSRYLTPHSDIVAHLVLAHQTQMHNVITETNYRTRLALFADEARNRKEGLPLGTISGNTRQEIYRTAEALVRYMLFTNEAALREPVSGSAGFTEEFARLGPRDTEGRSLRDFDLKKRIFRYPCSYLIYSEAFDAIPSPAKEYVLSRLLEILTGRDRSESFAALSSGDRRAVLEILAATKPGLPEQWRTAARATAVETVRNRTRQNR